MHLTAHIGVKRLCSSKSVDFPCDCMRQQPGYTASQAPSTILSKMLCFECHLVPLKPAALQTLLPCKC